MRQIPDLNESLATGHSVAPTQRTPPPKATCQPEYRLSTGCLGPSHRPQRDHIRPRVCAFRSCDVFTVLLDSDLVKVAEQPLPAYRERVFPTTITPSLYAQRCNVELNLRLIKTPWVWTLWSAGPPPPGHFHDDRRKTVSCLTEES